jgi:hypothetical protein
MKVFILREERNAQALWAFLRGNWKAMAEAGKPLQVTCGPEETKRSLQQNKRYWAILRQISDEGWLDGRQYSSEVWHEHFRREFIGCIDLPGGGLMGMSTTKLTVEEFSTYCTRVEAFAAMELGIQLIEMESAS